MSACNELVANSVESYGKTIVGSIATPAGPCRQGAHPFCLAVNKVLTRFPANKGLPMTLTVNAFPDSGDLFTVLFDDMMMLFLRAVWRTPATAGIFLFLFMFDTIRRLVLLSLPEPKQCPKSVGFLVEFRENK